jgi:GDP/UDP-N,N'-diacetylbacillosamine 2-epimerase (hydrolysing)
MKIALLTSSRADYSIYVPLIRAILAESWELEIIAFGTHTSVEHGLTYQQIEQEGFSVSHRFVTRVTGDQPSHIAKSMALTMQVFSEFWSTHEYDLIIALGDRYEMFVAVTAAMPFNYKVAHIAGGETTIGAIDNAFRHSISHMSQLHFVVAQSYADRLQKILGSDQGIYNTGSLSVENFRTMELLTRQQLFERWGVDEHKQFLLMTIHPETVSYEKNSDYIDEVLLALDKLQNIIILITMPNADTMGDMIRKKWIAYAKQNPNVRLIENFGGLGYLSAMKYCEYMLGNSSSGFVEASMFPKWVINLGNRQQGRIMTPNIIQSEFDHKEILRAISTLEQSTLPDKIDIYGDGYASTYMVDFIKSYFQLI